MLGHSYEGRVRYLRKPCISTAESKSRHVLRMYQYLTGSKYMSLRCLRTAIRSLIVDARFRENGEVGDGG